MPKFDILLKTEGIIDVLVNNAGVLINKPFKELTETDFAICCKAIFSGMYG